MVDRPKSVNPTNGKQTGTVPGSSVEGGVIMPDQPIVETQSNAGITKNSATTKKSVERRNTRLYLADNLRITPRIETIATVAECSWWDTKHSRCHPRFQLEPLTQIMYGLSIREHPITWRPMKIGFRNFGSPNDPDMVKQEITQLIQYSVGKYVPLVEGRSDSRGAKMRRKPELCI